MIEALIFGCCIYLLIKFASQDFLREKDAWEEKKLRVK